MAGLGNRSGGGKNKQKKPSQEGLGEWGGAGSGVGMGKWGVLLRRSGGHQFCQFLSNLLLVEVDC